MDKEKAINIAIGCVMASGLDIDTAREVIDVLRELETEDSKLGEIIDYFELREGYDINEVIEDIVYETELLAINESPISMDECAIVWGEDDYICELDIFIRKYTDEILKKVVNVIKSYKEDDNMAIAGKPNDKMMRITIETDGETLTQQHIKEIDRHLEDISSGKLKIRDFAEKNGESFALFNKKGYQIGRIYIEKAIGKSERF